MGYPTHNDGEWRVEECGTSDCWCRIIMSDKPNCESPSDPGNPTSMDYCIIRAGDLRAHNAPLVSAAPNLYRACKRALSYLNFHDDLNCDGTSVVAELRETLAKAETEDVQHS